MSDIVGALNKLNTNEVAQDKPLSEALHSKIGANINALIDFRNITFDLFTASGSWVAPTNVTSVIVYAVGGGGGGGEAGHSSQVGVLGDDGTNGGTTTFNALTVANGGLGGDGATFTGGFDQDHGRGGGGGNNGSSGIRGNLNARGGSGPVINGSPRGSGGSGGASGANGGGGASGFHGYRVFTVIPGNSYAVSIGAGGAGGSGNTSGQNGSAGSDGALIVIYGAQ